MTATCTFDVFTGFDGFGAYNGDWSGCWGKQGHEMLARRLAHDDRGQRIVFGVNSSRLSARSLARNNEKFGVRVRRLTRLARAPSPA